MNFFQDSSRFDPERDGKVPLRRTWSALAVRFVHALCAMLFSRHPLDAARWVRSMVQRRRPLSYALPWITFKALRAIERHIRPGMRIFEYGSGHSTLYWARRGMEIHSVEDDRGWHDLLADRISKLSNVHLNFEPTMEGYLARIERAGGLFDVVVVDGSHRKQCLAMALPFVKEGGILVVDNTDWHWFSDVDTFVPEHWPKFRCSGWAPFIGHASETTLWVHEAKGLGKGSA